MKPGVRALGIAESYRNSRSTLAGAVVRADGVVDGLTFSTCTVGGTDATEAVVSLVDRIDRPDVRYVLLGTVVPAWYNVIDLERLAMSVTPPVIAITFEDSSGLESGLYEAFEGDERRKRLERYRSLPARRRVSLDGDDVFVRSIGIEPAEAADVVRAYTLAGGRPEPVRVARIAARAADNFRRDETDGAQSGDSTSGSDSV